MYEAELPTSVSAQATLRDESKPHGLALRVVDLRKSFTSPSGTRIDVLRGINLESEVGECVAITGASGSGKSTLLHLLGGLDAPDHGSISLGDQDVTALKGRDLTTFHREQIGFIFQFHYLLPDLSAVENVAMPLLIKRRPRKVAFREARKLLTEFGMEEKFDDPVTHLSGGEQQRIAVARAIIGGPRLLLADEPTGNLDASNSEDIARMLTTYAREKSAIAVVATHSGQLARLCNRVLVLRDGRIYPS